MDNDQTTSSIKPLNETHGTLKQLQQATSSTFTHFNKSKKSKSYRQTPNKDLVDTGSYQSSKPKRVGIISLRQKSKEDPISKEVRILDTPL